MGEIREKFGYVGLSGQERRFMEMISKGEVGDLKGRDLHSFYSNLQKAEPQSIKALEINI